MIRANVQFNVKLHILIYNNYIMRHKSLSTFYYLFFIFLFFLIAAMHNLNSRQFTQLAKKNLVSTSTNPTRLTRSMHFSHPPSTQSRACSANLSLTILQSRHVLHDTTARLNVQTCNRKSSSRPVYTYGYIYTAGIKNK